MADKSNQSGSHAGGRSDKARKGDTSRTSNQGRKESSGGSKDSDNRGRSNEDNNRQSEKGGRK